MKLITDKKAIVKGIGSVDRRGKKLDADIQVLGASIVQHIEKHGDYTDCQPLIDAIRGKGRKVAMREYFLKFGKVKLEEQEDEKGKKVEVLVFDKSKTTDLQGAMDTLWTSLEPEPKVRPLELEQAFIALAKRTVKHMQEPVKGDELNPELVALLQQVAPEQFEELEVEVNETSPLKDAA